MGSCITYGLGSENRNLPGFIVFVSGGSLPSGGKAGWGSGFLPSVYQGVQRRASGDPVLYLTNPDGMDRLLRRVSLDAVNDLNRLQAAELGDPETLTRFAQYEMAFRMQVEVPELMDRPVTALIKDLKKRGLLEETLVVGMGEPGRTPFRKGRTAEGAILGRDHHPFSNTMFMAGGGMRPGMTYGVTDEPGPNDVENSIHVHDVQATTCINRGSTTLA